MLSVGRLADAEPRRDFGLRQPEILARVRRNKGPIVKYPARELLGLADADLDRIADIVLDYLSR